MRVVVKPQRKPHPRDGRSPTGGKSSAIRWVHAGGAEHMPTASWRRLQHVSKRFLGTRSRLRLQGARAEAAQDVGVRLLRGQPRMKVLADAGPSLLP